MPLGVSLCALLLTCWTSGVPVSAADDDDVWADVVTWFNFDAFDADNRVRARAAAVDQPEATVSRTAGDTFPDDEAVSRHRHDFGQRDNVIQPASLHHATPNQGTSSRPHSGNAVNPKQCQSCLLTFSSVSSRRAHEAATCVAREPIPGSVLTRSREGYLVLQCRACKHQFRTKQGFHRHQRAYLTCASVSSSTSPHQSERPRGGPMFQCPYCPAHFYGIRDLDQHISARPAEMCGICRSRMHGDVLAIHLRHVHPLQADQI